MNIIQRRQITEVITKRQVTHTVVLDSIKYSRVMKVNVHVPNMDCNVQVSEPEIKWSVYTGVNILQDLPKRSVTTLALEEMFQALDINDRNGNGNQS
jgi:GTP:adenosylcobinamide-phosphate guanylyltransferase